MAAPRPMLSKKWSCSSVHQGVEQMLVDAKNNAGFSDDLDEVLLQNLEVPRMFLSVRCRGWCLYIVLIGSL